MSYFLSSVGRKLALNYQTIFVQNKTKQNTLKNESVRMIANSGGCGLIFCWWFMLTRSMVKNVWKM